MMMMLVHCCGGPDNVSIPLLLLLLRGDCLFDGLLDLDGLGCLLWWRWRSTTTGDFEILRIVETESSLLSRRRLTREGCLTGIV